MSTAPVRLVLAIALGLVACSDAETVGTTITSTATPSGATAVSASASDGPTADTGALLLLPWLPDGRALALTTPTSGAGQRPVLAWEDLDGAAVYSIVVYDSGGAPYWAWETEDTQVRLGLTERAERAPGPRIVDGMTWAVVAYDVDGLPIGSSPMRPIAP